MAKGKGKGAPPGPPPPSSSPRPSAPYKPPGGATVLHDLANMKLKPTETLVRNTDGTRVLEKRSGDGFEASAVEKAAPARPARLPRMGPDIKSEDAERGLVDGGFSRPYGVFDANQALVREGHTLVAHTSLVEYRAGVTEERVAALIQAQKDQGRSQLGQITISESWTDEALRYLRRERYPHEDTLKLAALNYANCTYVGGNYSDGGMVKAQEEELCRQFPALFDSLKSCPEAGADDGRFSMCEYKDHVFGARLGDGYSVARNVLFTEEVQCLRTPAAMSYRLLRNKANKVKAGFVEAAAPIFGRHGDKFFEEWRTNPEEWYERVFLNVFFAPKSIDPEYDVLVVGPWGCGAFGNDPHTVAQSFLNVIQKHRLLELYKEIHFCMGRSLTADTTVGGACNYNVAVFRQVLAQLGSEAVEDYTKDLQLKAAQWMDEER